MAGPEPGGRGGLLAISIVSFGGPLALAALYVPGLVADSRASTGLELIAAGLLFLLPLAVWWRASGWVRGPAGLTGFVQAGLGRRWALVQATFWLVSYGLYLLYTTADVVYDVLPGAVPGVRPYQPWLEVAIPVAVAALVLARPVVAIGALALVALVEVAGSAGLAVLAGTRTTPGPLPIAAFGPGEGLHTGVLPTASAAGNVSLLLICGSLPLFFGAGSGARAIRGALAGGYLIALAAVLAVVLPLARDPAFLRAGIPGVALVRAELGSGWGSATGAGLALSELGLLLVEYLALIRLGAALTGWPRQRIAAGVAGVLVLSSVASLADPTGFYSALIRPSLLALWPAQFLAVLSFPWLARRFRAGTGGTADAGAGVGGGLRVSDLLLALGAAAFMVFGCYAAVVNQAT